MQDLFLRINFPFLSNFCNFTFKQLVSRSFLVHIAYCIKCISNFLEEKPLQFTSTSGHVPLTFEESYLKINIGYLKQNFFVKCVYMPLGLMYAIVCDLRKGIKSLWEVFTSLNPVTPFTVNTSFNTHASLDLRNTKSHTQFNVHTHCTLTSHLQFTCNARKKCLFRN